MLTNKIVKDHTENNDNFYLHFGWLGIPYRICHFIFKIIKDLLITL
jgi:hypothetical protein